MKEIDRPTFNTLQYLTTVRPHLIRRDPWLIDKWTHETLSELLGHDAVEEFGRYTRSFYTLEAHYQNLWSYDRPILPKPNDPYLQKAIDLARRAFRLAKPVTSLPFADLRQVPYIPNSGAGYGYIGKKGDPGNLDKAIKRAHYSLMWWTETQMGISPKPFRYAPDLAWTRTQLGSFESPKIRHVWGSAFHNILLEGLTAAPLIAAYSRNPEPMVLGIHMFKKLPDIINKCLSGEGTPQIGVGIDFSKFDSSIQPWLIDEAFNILEENIIFEHPLDYAAFKFSVAHFAQRPVVMPDGRMWLKRVGVPSGSYFTSMVDSIANYIAITYAQLKIYQRPFRTWVLGDDSLFGIPLQYDYPDLNRFSLVLSKLGLTMHPEKAIVASRPQQLEFLGHCARGTSVCRDTAEMMRLALYPEYEVDGPPVSFSRIKGLLLESGLNSWPMINLFEYATSKFKREQHTELQHFDKETANWLSVVANVQIKPKELDLLKAWLIV